jgi:hypothetical protein
LKTSILIKSCPWQLLLGCRLTSSKLYDDLLKAAALGSSSALSQHCHQLRPSAGASRWRLWVTALLIWTLAAGCWAGGEAGAIAAPRCRSINGHQICILSIQRSAKYFWQYRTVISIDGETQPDTVYDCRQRQRLAPDGRITAFAPGGTGSWICRFFKQP